MLYFVGPKPVVDALIGNGGAFLAYQASVFVALPDAERYAVRHGYVERMLVPGLGFVELEAEVYGVEAEYADAKCLGDGCNEFRMNHRVPPFRLVRLRNREGT